MKARLWLTGLVFLTLFGCAAYKQLKPDPELTSVEGKYIELKRGDKEFKLKKNKRYFIAFPPPQHDNFYLVLSTPDKSSFRGYFTKELVKKKYPGEKIEDQTVYPDSVFVYPVSEKVPEYYWLIDSVKQDIELSLQYRYAPQWRYKFETKHAEYKSTLEANRVDRDLYETVGNSFNFDCNFNYPQAVDTVVNHTAALENVHKELLAIESIFPDDIDSNDEAYRNYQSLKKGLEEEMAFQKNYRGTLQFFYADCRTRGKPSEYLGHVDSLIEYFDGKKNYPANVVSETQKVITKRMSELPGYYQGLLATKTDYAPLDSARYKVGALAKVEKLFATAGVRRPEELVTVSDYVLAFDSASRSAMAVKDSLNAIGQYVAEGPSMPPNTFFGPVVKRLSATKRMVPQQLAGHGTYSSLSCTKALNEEIQQLSDNAEERLWQVKEANKLVPALNVIKSQGNYKGMLGLLRKNSHLTFLMDKYQEVDKLSVNQQASTILENIREYHWKTAEANLRGLHTDVEFLNPQKVMPHKEMTVLSLEDSLYSSIIRVSRYRVNKFLEERVNELETVDSLYTDSVWTPAYDVTFSSGGQRDLYRKKEDLVAHLQKMKENEFPAKAVTLLYDEFVKNFSADGVIRARAIVTHGKYYKGEDLKILRRIAESDPYAAKWITEPKRYRRVFALPVTSNKRGKNKFVVRLNVRIETKAKFPVYDVNIKLPKEVARNAASEQWYDEISVNKKLLKNEGRFSITAPTAANDYECQVTPVQMNQGKNNVLHIEFTYPAYKVFPVSVMVQKPIIKKN